MALIKQLGLQPITAQLNYVTEIGVIIHGTAYDDALFGTGSGDTIFGQDGNDSVSGGDGEDYLNGGAGNDILDGGDDDDFLVGGTGADTLIGGNGFDTASYQWSATRVYIDLSVGAALYGDAQGDTFSSIERIVGSSFGDTIIGDYGYGYNHDNTFEGGDGNDTLDGGAGNDTLIGGTGADQLIGGNGIDTASYAGSSAAVVINLNPWVPGWPFGVSASGGDAQGDTLSGIENVIGSSHGDTLTGGLGDSVLDGADGNDVLRDFDGAGTFNTLNGGAGNDTLIGGAAADHFNGGAGDDTVDYSKSQNLVAVDLSLNVGIGGAAGDTFEFVEKIVGSDFGDVFVGDQGIHTFEGRQGNDWFRSGATGAFDFVTGGSGSDKFYVDPDKGALVVTDFTQGVDKIVIDTSHWGGLTPTKLFVTDGSSTHGVSLDGGQQYHEEHGPRHRYESIHFDRDTGVLAWDGHTMAILDGVTGLTSDDFWFI